MCGLRENKYPTRAGTCATNASAPRSDSGDGARGCTRGARRRSGRRNGERLARAIARVQAEGQLRGRGVAPRVRVAAPGRVVGPNGFGPDDAGLVGEVPRVQRRAERREAGAPLHRARERRLGGGRGEQRPRGRGGVSRVRSRGCGLRLRDAAVVLTAVAAGEVRGVPPRAVRGEARSEPRGGGRRRGGCQARRRRERRGRVCLAKAPRDRNRGPDRGIERSTANTRDGRKRTRRVRRVRRVRRHVRRRGVRDLRRRVDVYRRRRRAGGTRPRGCFGVGGGGGGGGGGAPRRDGWGRDFADGAADSATPFTMDDHSTLPFGSAKKKGASSDERRGDESEKRKKTRLEKTFSCCEVLRRRRDGRALLVARGNVYDATLFLADHPVGPLPILRGLGRDNTEDMQMHSAAAQRAWGKLKIGVLRACPARAFGPFAPPKGKYHQACVVS